MTWRRLEGGNMAITWIRRFGGCDMAVIPLGGLEGSLEGDTTVIPLGGLERSLEGDMAVSCKRLGGINNFFYLRM